MGYLIIEDRSDNTQQEFDTLSCKHCQAVIILKREEAEQGGFCMQCMAPLCMTCAAKKACVPFLKQIEHQLMRQEQRRHLMEE